MKILIVDDEEEVRESLTSFLSKRGFEIMATEDGDKALLIVKTEKPDLVLLDLQICGLPGVDVLAFLRKHHPHVKVIVVTGNMHNDNEVDELGLAWDKTYFRKPVEMSTITSAICAVLGIKDLCDQVVKIPRMKESTGERIVNKKDIVHKLCNLMGIVKNKCEDFTLSYEEGLMSNLSEKEIIETAIKYMRTIMDTTDKAVAVIQKMEKPSSK